MASRLPTVKLADKYYTLLSKITTGQKSVVWKAVQWAGVPDPETAEPIQATGQELVAYLRDAPAPGEPDPTQVPRGTLVALKVAKTGADEADLRKEAETLRGFVAEMWHLPGRAQVASLIEPGLPAHDLPILILQWVSGSQLDRLPEPFPETEGLFVAQQLASVLILIQGTQRLVLTDTLKPNSLFWDRDAESLVLTDWNVLGRPSEFRAHTLPIVGNTLHRLLAGKTVEWVSDTYQVLPESVGGTPAWSSLTYGTVALIRRALLADFSGSAPDDLARQLYDAIKEQWELWDENADVLLSQARSERGEAAVRRYDLARARRGGSLGPGDEERMVTELKNVVAGYGENSQHVAALVTLSWARMRYPHDRELRWAWLAHTTATLDRSGLRKASGAAMSALRCLSSGEFEEAITMLEAAEDQQSPHVKALLAEARVWRYFHPAEVNLPEARKALGDLIEVWNGYLDGETAVADVRDAVSAYQGSRERNERLKEESLAYLKRQDVSAAADSLRRLAAEAPGIPDLPLWIQAVDSLARGQYVEALERLHPADPASPGLSEPGQEHARQIEGIAARHLRQEAGQAKDENCFKRAIALLEPVVRCVPGDREAKRLLEECHRLLPRYEQLQAGARRTQPPGEEIGALDRWIDDEAGFNFDTNGLKPGRNLVVLRFERAMAWAEGLARGGKYAEANDVLHTVAIGGLHARRAIGALDEHARTSMEEQALSEEREWKEHQRQTASEYLSQAKSLFDSYAADHPARPSDYPAERYTAREMIDALVARAGALVQQALNADSEYQDALAAQIALDAFRRGRLALERVDVDTAASELARAAQYAWEGLRRLVRPYMQLAHLAQQMLLTGRQPGTGARDMVGRIVAYARAGQELRHVRKVEEALFDAWLDELPRQLEKGLGESVDSEIQSLEARLEQWLAQWPRLVAGGNALPYRSACQDWLDALDEGLRESQAFAPLKTQFERWRNRILACNYDLAHALLRQAGAHAEQGRLNLTREAEAEALHLVQEAGGIDHPSRQKVAGEVSRLLGCTWQHYFTADKMPEGLEQVYRALESGRPELNELADTFLDVPDPSGIATAVQTLAGPEGDVEHFASQVSRYRPTPAQPLLFSYETAAVLVRAGRYAEARAIAGPIARVVGGDQAADTQPAGAQLPSVAFLSDAIDQRIRDYCGKLFRSLEEAVREAPDSAVEVLHDGLRGLDPDLSGLAQAFGTASAKTDSELAGLAKRLLDAGQAEEFVKVMASIPVAQWDDELRDGLRRALADQYAEEVRKVTDRRLLGAWVWLADRQVRASIRQAERDARWFNTLSSTSTDEAGCH